VLALSKEPGSFCRLSYGPGKQSRISIPEVGSSPVLGQGGCAGVDERESVLTREPVAVRR
jgi:hypothetical protein